MKKITKKLEHHYSILAIIVALFTLGFYTASKLNEINSSIELINDFISEQEENIYTRAYAVLNSDLEHPSDLDIRPSGKQDLIAGCKNENVKLRLIYDFNGKGKEWCNYVLD